MIIIMATIMMVLIQSQSNGRPNDINFVCTPNRPGMNDGPQLQVGQMNQSPHLANASWRLAARRSLAGEWHTTSQSISKREAR